MADTVRTLAAVQAILADNITGSISPQDMRDFLVSVFGVFGGVHLRGGSTAQAGVTTTPEKMTGFDTNTPAIGTTPDHTDDSIALPTPGYYVAHLNVSYSGTINTVWDFEIAEDGVGSGFAFQRKLSSGGDVGDASCLGIIQTTVGGEKLSVLVNSDAGGGASFTPVDAQLIAFKVA